MQTLDSYVAASQLSDRHAAAAAERAARAVRRAAPSPSSERGAASGERILLRRSARRDAADLDRLAALDGARRPAGDLLVAEVDGEILAALPFDGGRAIADPFRPTADLVALLGARRRLLSGAAPAGSLQRLRPRLPRVRVA
jgi:hypothetical protein